MKIGSDDLGFSSENLPKHFRKPPVSAPVINDAGWHHFQAPEHPLDVAGIKEVLYRRDEGVLILVEVERVALRVKAWQVNFKRLRPH